MFSGLTNQVTSWMGSAKGDQEEKVPTPTTDESNALVNPEENVTSPTKTGGGKLEMLANVQGKIQGIGGWLGSSIPKLRKGEEAPPEGEQQFEPTPDTDLTKASTYKEDDDENSGFRATGGADSGPGTPEEMPTEDKDGQFGVGQVQSKALAGAKSFGSFLYSAVNKAGAKVSEASAKIKETVEKNSILGEFNKEQEAFLKDQSGNTATALPPWVGCSNEEALKDECLSLSTDRRNFVRSPPAGVDFQFDYEVSYPVAMAIMEQDPNLEKMRYELVPKVINEENFWRNYFYRVSLICQANELSFMSREGDSQSETLTSDQQNLDLNPEHEKHEFISDTVKTSCEDLQEVQKSLKHLTLGVTNKEDEWEKELEAELQDYEVVSEQQKTSSAKDNWEKEMEDMLHDELTDLK